MMLVESTTSVINQKGQAQYFSKTPANKRASSRITSTVPADWAVCRFVPRTSCSLIGSVLR